MFCLGRTVDRVPYRGKQEQGSRRRSTAALLSAYHDAGDRHARAQVIEENLPLVHSLARRFSRPSEPLDDLVQVGAIGLIKAVDGFRTDRGRELGPYAVPTIVGELRRHVRGRPACDARAQGRPPATLGLPDDESLEAEPQLEADRSEARALVRAGLQALEPRERRIVALRYYADLSQQRIGEEVGLSQVQVSRVLSAALDKMRATLEAG